MPTLRGVLVHWQCFRLNIGPRGLARILHIIGTIWSSCLRDGVLLSSHSVLIWCSRWPILLNTDKTRFLSSLYSSKPALSKQSAVWQVIADFVAFFITESFVVSGRTHRMHTHVIRVRTRCFVFCVGPISRHARLVALRLSKIYGPVDMNVKVLKNAREKNKLARKTEFTSIDH